ncbi:MAG: hypothetical protein KJP06_04360, partial [Deltaproteobacteria bacterium]|nr:hypothetical protein [Deltaproteobacteria bacterium]
VSGKEGYINKAFIKLPFQFRNEIAARKCLMVIITDRGKINLCFFILPTRRRIKEAESSETPPLVSLD